jgi:hypothetical protein
MRTTSRSTYEHREPRRPATTPIPTVEAVELEFANEMLTGMGEEIDKTASKRWRARSVHPHLKRCRKLKATHKS